MKIPRSMKSLEEFGRTRLSEHFYMRDFLYSEISNFYAIPNVPDNPDLAVKAGTQLCSELLEPIQARFGAVSIRSAYRSRSVNQYGNVNRLNCADNSKNYGHHIWDHLDSRGYMGATACIVVPWFADQYSKGADWRALAWWIHDNLPYSTQYYFPKLAAFNLQWHEKPTRRIDSYIKGGKGNLTKPGKENHQGNHSQFYDWFPKNISNEI
ncbi:MAG: hypothetical protein GY761_15920 [Hyphomicrobiales bacterium]|nr:hypothetical protein [Hyphomicrobiales bacterium]